ncbi:type II toxin-antitoxin system RelE/ParE family toxin [Jiella avicenniae]|uniref:Type II toxin-antitoxin system RelE/ParE family toxin n=1 Tax=Jiella avicenniae TaxID=2907202 RepID=A0A9X1P6Y7_9HYPH|nr:type II toxin-antitoxin system RelE/ParE family toxin [Jiella avicenniae]MCE7030261.1 type II toxin-antitoxin system RelE/ParE family toxin [Jiella avicenniae]
MKRVAWEAQALFDFSEALSYLAARDERAALKLEQRVSDAITMLARHSIGRSTKTDGVRQKLVLATSYRVYYRETSTELTVLRVWHQRRKGAPEGIE